MYFEMHGGEVTLHACTGMKHRQTQSMNKHARMQADKDIGPCGPTSRTHVSPFMLDVDGSGDCLVLGTDMHHAGVAGVGDDHVD